MTNSTPELLAMISNARAAWVQATVAAVAAAATFSAVAAAFIVQKRQQNAEEERRLRVRREQWLAAIDGCRLAVREIVVIHLAAGGANPNAPIPPNWHVRIAFGQRLVSHYLSWDLAHTEIVVCFLNAQVKLEDASLQLTEASKGVFPMMSAKANFERLDREVDDLLKLLDRVAANLDRR